MENKKQLNQLNCAYTKKFKALSRQFFDNKESGLIFFIEYLRYLRDSLVLEFGGSDGEDLTKTKLATLVTAIAEVDAYFVAPNLAKKTFHWNNFCELLKLSMEDWLDINDSV